MAADRHLLETIGACRLSATGAAPADRTVGVVVTDELAAGIGSGRGRWQARALLTWIGWWRRERHRVRLAIES